MPSCPCVSPDYQENAVGLFRTPAQIEGLSELRHVSVVADVNQGRRRQFDTIDNGLSINRRDDLLSGLV